MAPAIGNLTENEQKLIESVSNGKLEEIKTLLGEPDTKCDCLDSSGMTPLMTAAYKGHHAICRYLLAHGADVNSNNHTHGYTALMFAALSGNTEVVQTMMEAGARVSSTNTVDRNAAQMAAFVGQHQVVSVINNFYSREGLEYYTRPQGLETEPKLPAALCTPLYQLICKHNLNPVKMSMVIQMTPQLLENSKPVLKVLDLLVEKMMKQKETNESMAIKFHYLYKLVQKCKEWSTKNDGNLDGWIKKLSKAREDGCLEYQERFLRDVMKTFPYSVESQLFAQMIRALAAVNIGSDTTALSIITGSVNGQRFASEDDHPCSTCGAFDAEKKCAKCKVCFYCDQRCQKLDWTNHKGQCSSFNEMRIRNEKAKEEEKKRAAEEEERKKEEELRGDGSGALGNAKESSGEDLAKVPES